MQHIDLYFFLTVVISYATFGLAIYAIAGWVALMWIRKKSGTPRPLLRDMYLGYASIIGLIFLDACRQLWESFQQHQFPTEITRVLLPFLYLVMGNAMVRFSGLTFPEPGFSHPVEEVEKKQQAGS